MILRLPLAAAALLAGVLPLVGPAAPAAASLVAGTWNSPAAGVSVSGRTTLDISTTATSVTFTVPHATLTGTLSAGHATAAWDASTVPDGPVTLIASECDLTGCADLRRTVTVANPVPVITPGDGAVLSPGGSFTVANPPARTTGTSTPPRGATVTVSYRGPGPLPSDQRTTGLTLPQTMTLRSDLAPGSYTVAVSASYDCDATSCPTAASVLYSVRIPPPPPSPSVTVPTPGAPPVAAPPAAAPPAIAPVLTQTHGPRVFHPVKDGVGDEIVVTAVLNQPGLARLVVRKGRTVVRRGPTVTVPYGGQAVSVRSGRGLAPGRYRYFVEATGVAGTRTTSPLFSVVGDAKTLHPVTAVLDADAAKVAGTDISGSCSTAKVKGTAVVLRSNSLCVGADGTSGDVASALFFPQLAKADAYGPITLTVRTSGYVDGLLVYRGDTTTLLSQLRDLRGTTTLRLTAVAVDPATRRLVIVLGSVAGDVGSVEHLHLSYVRRVLR